MYERVKEYSLAVLAFIVTFSIISCTNEKRKTVDSSLVDTIKQDYYAKYIVYTQNKFKKDELTYDGKPTGHYINAQKILSILIKDITTEKANEIVEFYKEYYRKWAAENDNYATLQLWFYKKECPVDFYDLDKQNKLSDREFDKWEINLLGNIMYVYSDQKYIGTLK